MTALSRHRSFGGGRICVDIERAHEPIAHVRLDLPDAASLVLAGKSAAEAVPFVPALYAVCGHAHGAASAGALAVAEGRTVAPRLAAAREALADMEAMREGIVRCALAWPQIVGANDRPHPVRTVIVLVAALRRALFGDRDPFASDAEPADDLAPALRLVDQAEAALLSAALAEPAAAWLARRDPARIAEWASAGATPAARLIDLVLRRGWAGDGAVPRVSLGDAGVSRTRTCWRAAATRGAHSMPCGHACPRPDCSTQMRLPGFVARCPANRAEKVCWRAFWRCCRDWRSYPDVCATRCCRVRRARRPFPSRLAPYRATASARSSRRVGC